MILGEVVIPFYGEWKRLQASMAVCFYKRRINPFS